jgi:heat shock protein HslJ
MTSYKRIGLLLAIGTLAACNAGAPATPSPAPLALDGRTFVSASVTDGTTPHPLVPGTQISLAFAAANVSGNAGCNTMSGGYTIEGNVLVIAEPMISTQMACGPLETAQDQWLSGFLTSRPTVALSGNDLVLANSETTLTMIDQSVAQPAGLVGGVWLLDSTISGSTVTSVPDGVTSTLTFSDQGTVAVQPGCNTGSTDYTVSGTAIDFGPIALTRMACEGAAGEIETEVLAVLDASPLTYSIAAGVLTIESADAGLMYVAQ